MFFFCDWTPIKKREAEPKTEVIPFKELWDINLQELHVPGAEGWE